MFFTRLLVLFSLAAAWAVRADQFPAGVEVRDYTGWFQSIYLNATELAVQAVIVPAVGGRVVHFSLDGENILMENSLAAGQTAADNAQDLWLGGYQCDLGANGKNLPPHLQLLQGANTWDLKGDFAARVASAPDTNLGVVIEKNFLLAPDTGELGVMQQMRNVSSNEISYYLRDRTLCKKGGFAFFPLNKKSAFKAGWSQRRQKDGKDYFDGDHPDAFQAKVLDGVLVVSGNGGVTQIGADSPAGWVAYAFGHELLVKYFPIYEGGHYSDGGNTVEIYFDQRGVELSPLSPEIKLPPGGDFTFPEKWLLIHLKKEVTTWDQARKLVRKIPPSSFRN